MPEPCRVCAANADARRRAEADLAEAVRALADMVEHARLLSLGDPTGLGADVVVDARGILARHVPPETWRRGVAT